MFLDTDIISYYFGGNTLVKEKLVESIDNGEEIYISIITVYEIIKGFRYKNNRNKENVFNIFLKTLSVSMLDHATILTAAGIYAGLRKKGITIGDTDILIAATVIENNGTLVSNNIKHYQYIHDLNLVNWL
jgi:predicted nucleic acid-binding protein